MTNKRRNEYIDELGADFYRKTPKAVFAAIALSLAMQHSETLDDFEGGVLLLKLEWGVLYNNHIIPQAPPRR